MMTAKPHRRRGCIWARGKTTRAMRRGERKTTRQGRRRTMDRLRRKRNSLAQRQTEQRHNVIPRQNVTQSKPGVVALLRLGLALLRPTLNRPKMHQLRLQPLVDGAPG